MEPPHRSRTRRLRHSLSDLHAQLARTPRVDEPAARALREVLADIERLLPQERTAAGEGAAAGAEPTPTSPQDLEHRHRLEGLEVQLEARHPALAATLRELIKLLGQAGL